MYANLVGGQDELIFDGESLVFDRTGQLIFQAPSFESGVFTVDVPFVKSEQAIAPREQNKLASIYNALVLGVKDYVNKNGFSRRNVGFVRRD